MPIKSSKIKISKNTRRRVYLMSQGSLNPKIRFLGQNMCSVARGRTGRHTHGSFSFNLSSRIGPIYHLRFLFHPQEKEGVVNWVLGSFHVRNAGVIDLLLVYLSTCIQKYRLMSHRVGPALRHIDNRHRPPRLVTSQKIVHCWAAVTSVRGDILHTQLTPA